MKCFSPIISIIAVMLMLCTANRYIYHPLIITYSDHTVDTTAFYIRENYIFEIRTDDHFNLSWLVAVPMNTEPDIAFWRVYWLKRNVINYRIVDDL